ncbi:MAG: hypothetical protein ACYTEQ_23215 [Planctomycetota bacterium]|jgi:hypothetical protein
MTKEQFDDYLDGLKRARAVKEPEGSVHLQSAIEAIKAELVEFRDRNLPDEVNCFGVEECMDDLQSLSSWLIRKVGLVARNLKSLNAFVSEDDMRELYCLWLGNFGRMVSDFTQSEWKACEEANQPHADVQLKFKDLLLEGLEESVALGIVDDVYDERGVVVSNFNHRRNI